MRQVSVHPLLPLLRVLLPQENWSLTHPPTRPHLPDIPPLVALFSSTLLAPSLMKSWSISLGHTCLMCSTHQSRSITASTRAAIRLVNITCILFSYYWRSVNPPNLCTCFVSHTTRSPIKNFLLHTCHNLLQGTRFFIRS